MEKPIIQPDPTLQRPKSVKHSILGPIIGGVLGGFALISLISLTLWRRYRHVRQRNTVEGSLSEPQPFTSLRSTDGLFTAYPRKAEVEMEHSNTPSSNPRNESQGRFSQSIPSGPQNYYSVNGRIIELSAELQALQHGIRDDQSSVYSPPPSYATRPVD